MYLKSKKSVPQLILYCIRLIYVMYAFILKHVIIQSKEFGEIMVVCVNN